LPTDSAAMSWRPGAADQRGERAPFAQLAGGERACAAWRVCVEEEERAACRASCTTSSDRS
jgi:hypothetical protein